MKVLGLAGYSGAGKTTLAQKLIAGLREGGQRVSVLKHAHEQFDIDTPGKDSHRHREAGAFEVLVASPKRMALMREYTQAFEDGTSMKPPNVHALLREFSACDWVLVEGFKHSDLLKIEVWDATGSHAPLYPDDPFVIGVATTDVALLPQPTLRPVWQRDDAAGIVAYLLAESDRFTYQAHLHDI
jgi:molybdopterin-guanine dinucleotide biosynthesis adapter protein